MIRETFHTVSKIKHVLFKKKIEMKINYSFLEARFIDRPNRFLTRAEYNVTIGASHLHHQRQLKESSDKIFYLGYFPIKLKTES